MCGLHTYSNRLKFLISLLFILFYENNTEAFDDEASFTSIDFQKTKIWGPGLEPEKFVLPVRHFYIQPIDSKGDAYNLSMRLTFDVRIFGKSPNGNCRVQIELLDRKDGLYIVRYKMFDVCWNVEIHITYDGKYISNTPRRILGKVYSEKCSCPQDIDQWLKNHKCKANYEQIDEDLKPFTAVNFRSKLPDILKLAQDNPGSISVCHFLIKSNRIYRKCYGQYTGFKMFVDALLTVLVRIVKLPDTEFVVNLGDWPLVKKNAFPTHQPYPIFSWCGSEDTLDIIMPTYDLTESTLEAMSRVSIDVLSVQNAKTSWNEKKPILFWRGRDSRKERLVLLDIAREYPDHFNVSLTNFFFFRDQEAKYGPRSPHVSFFDFFDYKFQLNIDGTVAAYRFPYLLAGNSVVFKQESPFYEHFYKQLRKMYHYIPLKRDLSNLIEKITWATENDDVARKISQQGQKFVNENLTPDKILCYQTTLIKEWSERQRDKVQVESDMEELLQNPNECDCINERDEL